MHKTSHHTKQGEEWTSDYQPTGSHVGQREMHVAGNACEAVRLVEVPDGVADAHGLLVRTARECPNCVCLVCVPVVAVRAFARLCRTYVRRAREADAPAPVLVVGTQVDLVEAAPGTAHPLFAGVDRAAGERAARAAGALAYLECSAVSLFGVPNVRAELLRRAPAPRTAAQNVRGALRSAGMLLGWAARSLLASATHNSDDDEDDDPAAARARARAHERRYGNASEEFEKDVDEEDDDEDDDDELNDDEEDKGEGDILDEQEVDDECCFDVFVCGAAGAGTTALVRRYLRQPFVAAAPGRALGTRRFALRGRPYAPRHHEVALWDCAGVPPLPAHRGRCALVFAVDATRRDAPRATRALLDEIEAQHGTLYCSSVLALTHVCSFSFLAFVHCCCLLSHTNKPNRRTTPVRVF